MQLMQHCRFGTVASAIDGATDKEETLEHWMGEEHEERVRAATADEIELEDGEDDMDTEDDERCFLCELASLFPSGSDSHMCLLPSLLVHTRHRHPVRSVISLLVQH